MAGAAAVAGAAGWLLHGVTAGGEAPSSALPAGAPAPLPSGSSSTSAVGIAGITYPAVPQRHVLVTVLRLPGRGAAEVLDSARQLADVPRDVPADAGEVTVTIGFSAPIARELWPDRAALAADLPAFAGDRPDLLADGDIMLQICAETSSAVAEVHAKLLDVLGAVGVVWSRTGYRDAPTPEGTMRTGIGFVDGIINPRSAAEQTAGVWIDGSDDTFVVLRRMTVGGAFLSASVDEQERAIGRRRDTGAPLSGGDTMAEVDLFAKTVDGQVLTPNGSHARRAHPANIGRPLMLRRSYSFDVDGAAGVLFVAFMNDPQTFIATQRRLDEIDDLIRHTTTDATGCFFVPGADLR